MVGMVCLLFISCGGGNTIEPQFFTFNYREFNVANGDAEINEVIAGTKLISSYFGNNQCNFSLHFNPENGIPPSKSVSGNIGEVAFNMRLTSNNAIHINPDSNPETCEVVRDILFQIGRSTETVSLNVPTGIGDFSFVFNNVGELADLEFFSATITSFNPTTQRGTGIFSVLKRNRSANRNRLLAIEGSFAFNN